MTSEPTDQPEWVRNLTTAAFQDAATHLTRAGHVLAAQGAMGWLYRGGDLDRAREALTKLPPDVLAQVSVAATALAALADEVATEAPPGAQ